MFYKKHSQGHVAHFVIELLHFVRQIKYDNYIQNPHVYISKGSILLFLYLHLSSDKLTI